MFRRMFWLSGRVGSACGLKSTDLHSASIATVCAYDLTSTDLRSVSIATIWNSSD